MSEYLIVLSIETEEGQGDPAKWDWANVIDSPLPVGVVASIDATDQRMGVGLRSLWRACDDRYGAMIEEVEVMSDYEHGWTVVECYPNEKGADAIFRAHGVWRTEEEALDYLAECRDDDGAADGDAWTTVRLQVAS